jgi:hypothetical protein
MRYTLIFFHMEVGRYVSCIHHSASFIDNGLAFAELLCNYLLEDVANNVVNYHFDEMRALARTAQADVKAMGH